MHTLCQELPIVQNSTGMERVVHPQLLELTISRQRQLIMHQCDEGIIISLALIEQGDEDLRLS